jgi:hypothetical protein
MDTLSTKSDGCQTRLMETTPHCKAIMSQGDKRGERCWRPQKDNEYCGKHQSAAVIEKGVLEGLHKCSTHRCMTMLEEGVMRCTDCVHTIEERLKEKTICRGLITQGSNKGSQCDKEASTPEGFCGKHTIYITVEKAKEEGNRICDDGKRACKKYTIDGKTKCEDCLEIIRGRERTEHTVLRESGNCLGCGKEITETTKGYRTESVQRCETCYIKLQEIEETRRGERHRNYKQERKANMLVHYREYIRSAALRNKQFELTIDDFSELVNSRCEYCDYYDETEVVGIDRVNNGCGYIRGNVVPCCAECNVMKNDTNVDDFVARVSKIYKHYIEDRGPGVSAMGGAGAGADSVPTGKSYISPKKILGKYKTCDLNTYIEECVKDCRSPTFIDKIKNLSTMKLNEEESRKYIKNILKIESNSKDLDRKNINKKEMFGYLKLRNVSACVEHYGKVHGIPEGFREDIQTLVDDWNTVDECRNEKEFTRILVKYQNRRNAS